MPEEEFGMGDVVSVEGQEGLWKIVGMRDASEPRFQMQRGNDAGTQRWVETSKLKVVTKHTEPQTDPGFVPAKGIMD